MPVVKHINKKFISLLLIGGSTLLLGSCGHDEAAARWDGQWQRTVLVPKDVQGRCVDETLTISNKRWQLDTVVHATFECNQPFLEIAYEGEIPEVRIKRGSDDRDVRLQVSDIHLVAMFDIGKTGKNAVSGSMIDTLSEKYVPEKYQAYEQEIYLSTDGNSMESTVYHPVLDLAIPLYPDDAKAAAYQRVK